MFTFLANRLRNPARTTVGETPNGNRFHVYDGGEGLLDRYTFVMQGKDWDESANPGMKMMLGVDGSGGIGYSQWGEGQEGRHLGKRLKIDQVPAATLSHAIYRIDKE